MGWFAIEYVSNFMSITFQQTTIVKAAEIFNAIAGYYIAMRGFMLWVSIVFFAFILFVIGAIVMWVFNLPPINWYPMLNFFHIR